jgi:uncharacterized membrane protein
MRPVRIVTLLALAALVSGSLAAYPGLPERIPVHFGGDGRPDAWAERSLRAWLALPAVGAATVALLLGIAAWMPRRPGMLNVPDKERFLALPPARQAPIVHLVQLALEWMALFIVGLFGLIQIGAWRAAHGLPSRGWILASLLVGVVGSLASAVALVAMLQNRIDEQLRLHERDRAEGAPAL